MSIRVTTLDDGELTVGTMLGRVPPGIYIGHGAELPLDAVLDIAYYALTNTDLVPDDPRLKFVRTVKKLRVTTGWNGQGSKRLAVPARQRRMRRPK